MLMNDFLVFRPRKFYLRSSERLRCWLCKWVKELLSLALLLVAPAAVAASDIAGASDPFGIDRVPHSWIVLYQRDDELLNREFVVSRVDKTRRDVRVEREVRMLAKLVSATYEMSAGTRPEEVINHYLNQFGAGEAFSCRGRACGRSNDWANHIFEQAILYGPDVNQYYFAGELDDRLLALYVIQRGNKRVYAHLRVLTPENPVAVDFNREMVDQLSSTGFVTLEDIRPEVDGSFSDEALERLRELAVDLVAIGDQEVFVVCHLYGSQSADQLLQSATACSQTASEALVAAGGPELKAFAAGPLLPRRSGNVSRIELVLPHRLEHH